MAPWNSWEYMGFMGIMGIGGNHGKGCETMGIHRYKLRDLSETLEIHGKRWEFIGITRELYARRWEMMGIHRYNQRDPWAASESCAMWWGGSEYLYDTHHNEGEPKTPIHPMA
jgi:hypothetical protein